MFNNAFILKNLSVVLTMASLDKYVNTEPSRVVDNGGGILNLVKEQFNARTDADLMMKFVTLLSNLDKLDTVTQHPVTRSQTLRQGLNGDGSEYDEVMDRSNYSIIELLKKIKEEKETW